MDCGWRRLFDLILSSQSMYVHFSLSAIIMVLTDSSLSLSRDIVARVYRIENGNVCHKSSTVIMMPRV